MRRLDFASIEVTLIFIMGAVIVIAALFTLVGDLGHAPDRTRTTLSAIAAGAPGEIVRYYDSDAGMVCWVYFSQPPTPPAMTCSPVGDTRLDFGGRR